MSLFKNKYYSLKPILKKDAVYNVIFGERSNGKTYAVLKYVIEQWVKHGKQFAYVRRWKEDITGSRAKSIFRALLDNDEVSKITGGEYTGITYYSRRFYLCNYSDDGKPIYNDNDVLGHTFALSDNEHNKSLSYPKVSTIMFDEFLTKRVYLPDEFVLFMNTISTIVRQRTNVKIFMLGNTVNKYNPYFDEMGLSHAKEMQQGTIDIYRYGDTDLKVAVEYCATLKRLKENNYYFAFNNPKLNMITGGSWELDMYPHAPIKWKPKHVLFIYFIIFNDDIFQCEIIQKDNMTFTFIHIKTTPIQKPDKDLIYSLDFNPKMNYNMNIYKPVNKVQERVLWYFKTDRVYYQNNNVGHAIDNYLKQCKGR